MACFSAKALCVPCPYEQRDSTGVAEVAHSAPKSPSRSRGAQVATSDYAGFSFLFEPQHPLPHSFEALRSQHDAVLSFPQPSLQQEAMALSSFMRDFASLPQQGAPSWPVQQGAISFMPA